MDKQDPHLSLKPISNPERKGDLPVVTVLLRP